MQVEDDSEIQPTFLRPDIADVTGLLGGRRMLAFAESPLLVRAVCREVSIQQVRRDVEAVISVCGRLELLVSPNLYAILCHQAANAAMTFGQPQILQFLGHARSAIAAQRLLELILNMGLRRHVLALAATHRTNAPGAVTPRADVHDLAKAVPGQLIAVLIDEGKSHLFLSAKNTVAFFRAGSFWLEAQNSMHSTFNFT